MIYILDTYGKIMLIYQVKQMEFFGRGEGPLVIIIYVHTTRQKHLLTHSLLLPPCLCAHSFQTSSFVI